MAQHAAEIKVEGDEGGDDRKGDELNQRIAEDTGQAGRCQRTIAQFQLSPALPAGQDWHLDLGIARMHLLHRHPIRFVIADRDKDHALDGAQRDGENVRIAFHDESQYRFEPSDLLLRDERSRVGGQGFRQRNAPLPDCAGAIRYEAEHRGAQDDGCHQGSQAECDVDPGIEYLHPARLFVSCGFRRYDGRRNGRRVVCRDQGLDRVVVGIFVVSSSRRPRIGSGSTIRQAGNDESMLLISTPPRNSHST